MSRKRIYTALDWVTQMPETPTLSFWVGTDEWVLDQLRNVYRAQLQIIDDEYGHAVVYADETTPEEIVDVLQGGSLLYSGPKLVLIRSTPSGRQDKLRTTIERALTSLAGSNVFVAWFLPEYDGAKKPKLWPYTAVTPQTIIRFDERDDEEYNGWVRWMLARRNLKLSNRAIGLITASAQYIHELHNAISQLAVWADQDGAITDETVQQLAFGELDAVIEEVMLYMLAGDKSKMLQTIYRLDEQLVARNATTLVWRMSSVLHDCWHWIASLESKTEPRWSMYTRLFKELERQRLYPSELAIWEALAELSGLDIALKSTGSFQQEHRLLIQTLLPASERFAAGTTSRRHALAT